MTQLTPIKGFTNTPVSRTICILITVIALSLSIFQLKHYFQLSVDPFLIEYSQYWRVLIYQFAVINESDYMLTIILWFHFKNLERFYGSRKYLSLTTIFALYNSLICVVLMSLGQLLINLFYFIIDTYILRNNTVPSFDYRDTVFNQIVPGPLGVLSSLYMCYGSYVPVSYHFKILLSNPFKGETTNDPSTTNNGNMELTLTNHFQIHIIYTLLLLNNGFASIIPCLVGIGIGKLYSEDLLPGAGTWLLPFPLVKLFISPRKSLNSLATYVNTGFRGGYRAVGSNDSNPSNLTQDNNNNAHNENEDDQEETLDEIRSNESQHEIRAETPVRPFGSQLLDTFRS
ncbi:hypothetical protein HYPBUDRAFT_131820 [Hyphopichia burtonii NRRL Y-1933]|uniref:Derlin n=1 Tax=Hyphopichia burtonii NRRL Y-1933 TaxID=984485 RepID=A0A1E4RQU4_9ASCO|nr:hypothetical protein HYPBUDRAFT_131820 [Hyphopichia burtonii NRRL Y-1933]ODV69649.1 hypothetical protein HYPBUDRAFT_131820 [Hyphopichia burtonii NRRL Y-1933]